MDTTLSIKDYLSSLSSSSPTPGGGNVSAFAGALACSLGIMVCNLSYGKKKYLEVEADLKVQAGILDKAFSRFLQLANEDNSAFDSVMEAFRLPKETDEQKAVRSEQINQATYHAAEIPFEVISTCKTITEPLIFILNKGNSNSKSDAGVALLQVQAAANGALYNVLINCSSLGTMENAVSLSGSAKKLTQEITDLCSTALTELAGSF